MIELGLQIVAQQTVVVYYYAVRRSCLFFVFFHDVLIRDGPRATKHPV